MEKDFSKLEGLNLRLISNICEYLATAEVILLKGTCKNLKQKIEACPKLEIKILKFQLKNTETILEVSIALTVSLSLITLMNTKACLKNKNCTS